MCFFLFTHSVIPLWREQRREGFAPRWKLLFVNVARQGAAGENAFLNRDVVFRDGEHLVLYAALVRRLE